MSVVYLVTIVVLFAILIGVFMLMKYIKNHLLANIIFCLVIVTCYGIDLLLNYQRNGVNDWNFTNALPTANVSPFMFTVCPIFFLLPKSAKKCFGTLIALLFIGMILSPLFSCIYNFSIQYKFHPHFLLNYAAHIALALWGVYLVQSKQCELKIKECLIGGGIIVSVAIIMIILNVIFDKSFFGLSLNGKHNIYNVVLVSNSYLSALIYFTGLVAVMVGGFFAQKGLLKLTNKEQ